MQCLPGYPHLDRRVDDADGTAVAQAVGDQHSAGGDLDGDGAVRERGADGLDVDLTGTGRGAYADEDGHGLAGGDQPAHGGKVVAADRVADSAESGLGDVLALKIDAGADLD